MFTHIDHIGIAVDDLDHVLNIYCGIFGLQVTYDESVPEQGTRAIFLSAPSGPDIELLVPLHEESPVGKFLAKRGPGMHHICYAVPNLTAAIEDCLAAGLQMIDTMPRIGAKCKRLAFVHPKAVGGTLIELYEAK